MPNPTPPPSEPAQKRCPTCGADHPTNCHYRGLIHDHGGKHGHLCCPDPFHSEGTDQQRPEGGNVFESADAPSHYGDDAKQFIREREHLIDPVPEPTDPVGEERAITRAELWDRFKVAVAERDQAASKLVEAEARHHEEIGKLVQGLRNRDAKLEAAEARVNRLQQAGGDLAEAAQAIVEIAEINEHNGSLPLADPRSLRLSLTAWHEALEGNDG